MKPVIIIILIVLITPFANAEWFRPLTEKQKTFEAVYVLVTCIDWAQTKEFRAHGVKESNPILGEEPSQERVDTLIFLGIVSHVLFTWALPTEEWKDRFQGITFFFELEAVAHNYSHGWGPKISIQYKF